MGKAYQNLVKATHGSPQTYSVINHKQQEQIHMKNDSVVPALFTVLAAILLSPILYGWVSTYLWVWFIVPFGLPALALPHAIGLILTIRAFVGFEGPSGNPNNKRTLSESLVALIGTAFFRPFVVLFLGWIIHQFM